MHGKQVGGGIVTFAAAPIVNKITAFNTARFIGISFRVFALATIKYCLKSLRIKKNERPSPGRPFFWKGEESIVTALLLAEKEKSEQVRERTVYRFAETACVLIHVSETS